MEEKTGSGNFLFFKDNKSGGTTFVNRSTEGIFNVKKTFNNCSYYHHNDQKWLMNAHYVISNGCLFIKGTVIETQLLCDSSGHFRSRTIWDEELIKNYKITHHIPEDSYVTKMERPKWWKPKVEFTGLKAGYYLKKSEYTKELKTSNFSIHIND